MPSESIEITYAGRPVVQVGQLLAATAHNRWLSKFADEAAEKANCYRLPIGEAAGSGFVLMKRGDVADIDQADAHTLVFRGALACEIDGVYFIRATNAVPALYLNDPDALMLVEIGDIRKRRWWQSLFGAFNQTSPENGETEELYTTTPDDVEDILTQLWNSNLPSTPFGAFPGIPSGVTATAIPHNVDMRGIDAWGAINAILQHNGMAIRFKRNGDVDIVKVDSDEAIDDQFDDYKSRLIYDAEPIVNPYFAAPFTVAVHFPSDFPQWQNISDDNAVHPTDAGLIQGATVINESGASDGMGTAAIWGDVVARFNEDDETPAENLSDLEDRAEQLATAYTDSLRSLRRWTRKIYSGALPFDPGGGITAIEWAERGMGLTTEVQINSGVLTRSEITMEADWPGTGPIPLKAEGFPTGRNFRPPHDQWALVKLVDNIDPEGSGTATLLYISNSGELTESSKTREVTDAIGAHRVKGDFAIAIHNRQGKKWYLVDRGWQGGVDVLAANLAESGSANMTVTGRGGTKTITVYETLGLDGGSLSNTDKVSWVWDYGAQKAYVNGAECS